MITGYWISQSVFVAAKLGIAELVKDGPRPVEQLAQATGAHVRSLFRLLRALASVGMFVEGPPCSFGLTPLAEPLLPDAADSMHAMVLMMGEEHYVAWAHLLHSVRTGECAFDHAFGEPIFDWLGEHAQQAAIFDAAMTGIHGRETAAMLGAYDLSGVGSFVDVGGGNGTNLVEVLKRYPSMRGVLFDLPHVVERARGRFAAESLDVRTSLVGGSFFEQVPPGGDVYHLRHIIHDWDDAKSLTILQRCRAAMHPQARLILVESVIPPGNEPFFGKLLDLNMLVNPGGLERTEQEYRELLAAADLKLSQVVPTALEVSVVEAVCA
jgi:hypothetical protein